MAYIGMRYPVFAEVDTYTEGTGITYKTGTGKVIDHAVAATLTFNNSDVSDYGDDVVQETDKGINGVSLDLETNDLGADIRAALLGWKPVTTGSGGTQTVTHYQVTGANPPEVGMGFIRVKQVGNTRKFEGFWIHRMQFNMASENASTKRETIEFNHPTINGTGIGVYLDSSGEVQFIDYMEFATESAVKTWLNTKAGITP